MSNLFFDAQCAFHDNASDRTNSDDNDVLSDNLAMITEISFDIFNEIQSNDNRITDIYFKCST